jgi:hypothetical protein
VMIILVLEVKKPHPITIKKPTNGKSIYYI